MAIKGQPGEHLAAAKELLQQLDNQTGPATDQQVRATMATAHATLALAEQVAMIRHELRGT